ncbi:MAG: hypothetical protein Q4P24_06595, partial [Rhodobacterales bacterium]|nr:hypothetical protein [Rhodobacterales bacterium]
MLKKCADGAIEGKSHSGQILLRTGRSAQYGPHCAGVQSRAHQAAEETGFGEYFSGRHGSKVVLLR